MPTAVGLRGFRIPNLSVDLVHDLIDGRVHILRLTMTGVLMASPDAIEPGDQPVAVSSDTTVVTAVSAVAATLNNIGPGLGHVGPGDARAYSWVPPLGKVILVLCMLIGRLEVFTVVLLFTPWFYRQ